MIGIITVCDTEHWAASGGKREGKSPIEGGHKLSNKGFAEGMGKIKAACDNVGFSSVPLAGFLTDHDLLPHFRTSTRAI